MKYLLPAIYILITGCSNSDSNVTNNLDGKWAKTCDSTSIVNGIIGSSSNQQVMSFYNGNITNLIYIYSDTDCTNIVSIENNGLFSGLYTSYTTGNELITIDGNIAREINFMTANGDIFPDIYITLNNNSILHFGLKDPSLMTECPSSSGPLDLPGCWEIRPDEINYQEVFTKIIE